MAQEQIGPKQDQLDQPAYMLTPIHDFDYKEGDPLGLQDVFRILWRRRRLIVLGTLLCGVVTFLVSGMMPKAYEATTTMIVVPPAFSSELRSPAFSVETYLAITQSDSIMQGVRDALAKKDPSLEGVSLQFDTSKKTPNDGTATTLPMFDLKVEASTPEVAMLAANTWAEVLTSETVGLSERGKQGTLDFIQEQFPLFAKSLATKEESLREKADHYDAALVGLENEWRDKILRYGKETEDLILNYAAETERLLLEFNNETAHGQKEIQQDTEKLRLEFLDRWKPDLVQQELTLKKSKLALFETELMDTVLEIKSVKSRMAELKEELQSQPPLLVLSKAITDEAMWDRVSRRDSAGLPKSLDDLKMRTEVVNPLHQKLSEQLAEAQVKHGTLVPKRDNLKDEIARVRAEVDDLSEKVTSIDIELFNLTKGREVLLETYQAERKTLLKELVDKRASGRKTLEAERKVGEESLVALSENKAGILKREAAVEVGRLERERENAVASYKVLAGKHEAAVLARSEEDRDLKIAAAASLPHQPVKPRVFLATGIALVLGLMLSVALAFVLNLAQSIQTGPVQAARRLPDQPSRTRDAPI